MCLKLCVSNSMLRCLDACGLFNRNCRFADVSLDALGCTATPEQYLDIDRIPAMLSLRVVPCATIASHDMRRAVAFLLRDCDLATAAVDASCECATAVANEYRGTSGDERRTAT